MKISKLTMGVAVVFGLLSLGSNSTFAQTPVQTSTTTTTVTSNGTVSEFTPDSMNVRVSTSTTPVHYTFRKTTTYVDENGNPVSVETVKSGVPVTIYYEKNGDTYVADKVVVRKTVSTTTTTDPVVPVAPPTTSSTPPTVDGIVTDADSDEISIRNSASNSAVVYKAHDATTYVDEAGNPVARNSLKKGTPVTIYYERDGDDLLATRVVVKSAVSVEKTSTTTTETHM